MTNVSISKLKENPSKYITLASDYPVAIDSRNVTKAYLIGKDLYEKIVLYLENLVDSEAVKSTDYSKGKDFEEVLEELGL